MGSRKTLGRRAWFVSMALCTLGLAGYGLPATEAPARAEEPAGEMLAIPPDPVPPPESFAVEIPHPAEEGAGEIQTRGLGDNLACGTYLLRSKADNAMLHLNGLGDRLVSTRWQPNDDYVRFVLELQQDGSVRIRSKATGQYLYEEVGGDRLVSTRQAMRDDPRTNVWLEPASNGSVRIKSVLTRLYWHYNGLGDRLISSRWQTTDPYASFTLERVTGPTAVAACTTDVLEQVLAKEFSRAVFDRQAKLGALLQASDAYLAANPLVRTLAQGAPIVNLNTAVRQYLAKYPQGSRQVKIPELQALADQIQAMKASAGSFSAALIPTSASNATAMANAQSGLAAVQAAVEALAKSQGTMHQWGQTRLRNLAKNIQAAKGGRPGPVVAMFGAVPQIQSRAIPAGAINVALNKTASQSSTPYGQAGSARFAVDGNTNGLWGGGSVTHTDNQLPWWEVDLGAVYDISTIRIWNRTDCCRERLTQFRIVVGETPIVANDTRTFGVGLQSFGTEDSKEFTSTANTRGRYVRIMHTRQDVLSLAEVEVFGTLPAAMPAAGSAGTSGSGSTAGSEFTQVSMQSVITNLPSTIVLVTETANGVEVDSAVGTGTQYQQVLQSGQFAGRPTGNTVAPIVLSAPSSDAISLFEFASTTGSFNHLTLPPAACSTESASKAQGMFNLSAAEGCAEPEPELKSYDRGAGKPLSCASGQAQSGALCYETCQAGYTLVAGVCWQNCPSGFRDDGAFCAKPGNYTRKNYPWKFGDGLNLDKARARCLAVHPTVGCEKQGEIIYENCASGYNELMLDWCTPKCPSNMGRDIGVSCTKKTYSNPTPWGKPLSTCASGTEREGQLCYTTCKSGYYGYLTQCLPN